MDVRFYWIKIKDTFFTSDTVDFLMSQKNGSNYVVLYQMLCLKAINNEGQLARKIGEVLIPYDTEKIQRDCKWFDIDTVRVALELYKRLGLVYEDKGKMLVISNFQNMVGSETRQAGVMREKRERINKIEQTANQNKTFYIDNYTNKKRYGGNYYYVLERDKKRCASCGSTETLCVHHIIGYDENEPKSCNASSMITLCRTCHSNEHNNPHSVVTNKLLDDISFDMELYSLISAINPNSRGNNVTRELQESYSKVTQEKDIDIDKDKEYKERIYKRESNLLYGEYKWIALKESQYNKLVEDYGKEKIDLTIKLLDEYLQGNGNKNKYKDFNLVIRKAIRDKWFERGKSEVLGGEENPNKVIRNISDIDISKEEM